MFSFRNANFHKILLIFELLAIVQSVFLMPGQIRFFWTVPPSFEKNAANSFGF